MQLNPRGRLPRAPFSPSHAHRVQKPEGVPPSPAASSTPYDIFQNDKESWRLEINTTRDRRGTGRGHLYAEPGASPGHPRPHVRGPRRRPERFGSKCATITIYTSRTSPPGRSVLEASREHGVLVKGKVARHPARADLRRSLYSPLLPLLLLLLVVVVVLLLLRTKTSKGIG